MCLTYIFEKIKLKLTRKVNDNVGDADVDTDTFLSGSTGSSTEFTHPAILAGVSKYRLSIYVTVLLAFTAHSLTETTFMNQLLYQSCLHKFQHTKLECEALLGKVPRTSQTEALENKVQPFVATLLTVQSLIKNGISALFCFAAGPWSDKFGRRPMILLNLTGFTISLITLSTISYMSLSNQISSWWFILPSVPVAFTGGNCLMMTMINAYVCDVSSIQTRTTNNVIAHTMIGIGAGFGTMLSGIFYNIATIQTAFFTATGIMLMALVYFTFINVESVHSIQEGSKLKSFISMDLFHVFLATCTKARPRFHRTYIWIIISVVVIGSFITDGTVNLHYLFLNDKFDWSLSQYTTFLTIIILIACVVSILGYYVFIHLLKVPLLVMLFIVMVLNIVDSICTALSNYSWEIYGSKMIGSLHGLSHPVLKSMLSTFVNEEEIGTIFAVNSSFQYLVGVCSAPLYSAVYSLTLSFNAAFYYYLSTLLYFICLLLIGVLFILRKKVQNKHADNVPLVTDL